MLVLSRLLNTIFLIALSAPTTASAIARECSMPNQWQTLCPILQHRVVQTTAKMKLQESEAKDLERFLEAINYELVYLTNL
jgi:hypothetical protein